VDLFFNGRLQVAEQKGKPGAHVNELVVDVDFAVYPRAFKYDGIALPAVVDAEPFGKITGQLISDLLGILKAHGMRFADVDARCFSLYSVTQRANSSAGSALL